MSIINSILKAFVGDKSEKDVKAIQPLINKVKSFESALQALSHDELRAKTAEFKAKIQSARAEKDAKIASLKQDAEQTQDIDAREDIYAEIDKIEKEAYEISEKVLNEILPEAFAVVKETARRFKENTSITVTATPKDRELSATKSYIAIEGDNATWANSWNAAGKAITWDMIHYDVQLIGGVVLHQGKIAEMQTGEGKTLVATLPLYLNALTGNGVHLVTVNDYLAKRDSTWKAPLFEFHGMTVDCIDNHQPNSPERRKAYNADITYGTNNEFGFDYLRDNMAHAPEDLVQRKHNYAIVDEVDSVLIDDARTPLIISGPVPQGDRHEFLELKPKVENLVNLQRKLATDCLTEAKRLFDDAQRQLERIIEGKLLHANAVIGIWEAYAKTDDIFVKTSEGEELQLLQLRQQGQKAEKLPNYCLSDYIAPQEAQKVDYLGGFAVTTGIGIEALLEECKAQNDDYSYIMIQAVADRLAEAFAELMHEKVRREVWGYEKGPKQTIEELIKEKYVGIRPAPGYPACPDHTEKEKLFQLLDANRLGIHLTESFAMHPASAVSGWYFSHPESKYFPVSKIGKDQVEDYANRKKETLEWTEKWLQPNLNYK